MRDKKELAEEYIECYKIAKSLSSLRSSDESFNVFKLKKGLPVKYMTTKDPMILPMDKKLIGYGEFYYTQKGFYLIPNDFNGTILSFVLRGLTHRYFDIPMMCNARPMFGWYTFTNFKKNYPIILTEGVKDCIILQQYYPYVLAMLTGGTTTANANILRAMTNKLILAYDKDTTGINATIDDKKKFTQMGVLVQSIKPHHKDFGEDYLESNYLRDVIQEKLALFKKGQNLMGCLESEN